MPKKEVLSPQFVEECFTKAVKSAAAEIEAEKAEAAALAAKPKKAKKEPQRPDPKKLDLYYDDRDGSYWLKVKGQFKKRAQPDLDVALTMIGFSADLNYPGHAVNEHKWIRWFTQDHKDVQYAGPLAGHRVGIHETAGGHKFLVTEEAKGVFEEMPAKVKAPEFFPAFIQELLPEGQWTYVCHWLAWALEGMRSGDLRPGHAVFLVGEPQGGKSLFQNFVTDILGGRVANPTKYLSGETNFNGDLAKAEHWLVEDPKTTTDMRARREFADKVKEAAISRSLAIHPKNKEQVFVNILRRLTITLNCEEENIARIYPIDRDIGEKTMIFRCGSVQKAWEPFRQADGRNDEKAMWAKFRGELPRCRAWLLNNFLKVDPDLADLRFGVKAYHDPLILSKLSEMSGEERLLQLIDKQLFSRDEGGTKRSQPWRGMAIELEQEFKRGALCSAYETLCRGGFGQLGGYLGKLQRAATGAQRVWREPKHNGYTTWVIVSPENAGKEPQKDEHE